MNQTGSQEVLIVDDDPDAFMLLALALEEAGGCRATVAENAREALQAMYQVDQPFGGIFLDVLMPETTGLELCSVIRSIPGYDDVPVIMVSAMKDRRFVMEAFAAGASDYITKPFQISDVCVRFLRATKDRPERAHCLEGIAARGAPANEPVKSPDEAILLDDVERAVSRDAFHSYLLHAKARLKIPMHVRAVRIADFLRVYSDTPGQELAQALLSVARMLSGLTRDSGDMVTYFGNGVFVTCSTTGSSIGAPSLKSMIEEAGMPSTDPHDKRQFDLIVGLDIPLEPDTHADVFDVLNRAIDSANPHDAA